MLSGEAGTEGPYVASLTALDGRNVARAAGFGKTWKIPLAGLGPAAYILNFRSRGGTSVRTVALPGAPSPSEHPSESKEPLK
jgi:hypothetical protein